MLDGWTLAIVALLYVGILFVIAWFGDRHGRRWVANPWVYALSLAVYCTAWTFYGSVGRAAVDGIGFLPIYLGPTLAAAVSWVVVRKMVRISKRDRITSIADFLSARFGKSRRLSALVTTVAVVGTLPYLALQLKAVATSYLVLAGGADDGAALIRASALAAVVLAVFAILFGTRHVDLTEPHRGLVLAVAFESVVKLVAFATVGLWVVFVLHDGPGALFGRALERVELAALTELQIDWSTWTWMVLLAWSAVLFLPRQFQMAVVEIVEENHVRRAAWVFPLYLLAINLFVLPIAFAGRLAFDVGGVPTVPPDNFVLELPLAAGQSGLALLVFLGGLSAATSMVIVECVALSTMVANDLVLPWLLRPALARSGRDLGRRLVHIRRWAIVVIVALAQLYLMTLGAEATLVSIGLVSFAAIAQLAPAMLAGLFWPGATRRAVSLALLGGATVWAYTLPLPTLMHGGYLPAAWLETGPLGIGWLRPEALFGLEGLDPIAHAMIWSMLVNVGLLVGVSVIRAPSSREARQAKRFVDVFGPSTTDEPPAWRTATPLRAVRTLLARFLGRERTDRVIADYYGRTVVDDSAIADAVLIDYAERLLAGTTGAASAHVALRSVAEEHHLDRDEVLELLDESARTLATSRELAEKSRQLEHTTAELRNANEQLRELDRMKDDFLATMTHELRTPLTSIRAFTEILYDQPDLATDRRRAFLGIVLKENERLTRLVDQALDLAKIEHDELGTRSREDPTQLLDEALASFSAITERREIAIERRIATDLPAIEIDRDRIMQVVVNLLANATTFCKEWVRIEATVHPNTIEIAVADDGPGVPVADHDTVFDKFHQSETSTGHGSGLGLAICRGIVHRHGGRIWVEPSDRGGARFAFSLPIQSGAAS
ncbi:MAG: sensor histidine kinase [Acidobacteriota bacterium]